MTRAVERAITDVRATGEMTPHTWDEIWELTAMLVHGYLIIFRGSRLL